MLSYHNHVHTNVHQENDLVYQVPNGTFYFLHYFPKYLYLSLAKDDYNG
jgi:hypothetical protein